MEYTKAKTIEALIQFFDKDYRRIDHALSVLKHAERIAESKAGWDYEVLVASALLHDVGIKPAEQKHGHNTGKMQEEYGPREAEQLLRSIGFPPDKTIRVSQIIGNHHSPSRYNYSELEILKEADAIVNKQESTSHEFKN